MKRKYWVALISCVSLFGLDQLTKHLIMWNLVEGRDEVEIIDGFLLLEHARNTGAAFSMLEGQMVLFAIVAIVAVFLLGQMLWQLDDDDLLQASAIGIVASGALGNAFDRLLYGSVTDFIKFYTDNPEWTPWLRENIGMTAWPTFNVADIALVVGLILFFAHTIFFSDKESEEEDAEQDAGEPERIQEDTPQAESR